MARDHARGGRGLSSGWGVPFALRAAPGGGTGADEGTGPRPPQPAGGRGHPTPPPPARAADVIWHEVECGAYAADLPLWEELADEASGPVLELGCGTGRVALHLARLGHRVHGLDLEAGLAAALTERADGLPAEASAGDARDFDLETEFGLVLAPMQLLQLLADADQRRSCLRCVAAHLRAGGLAAFAIVEEMPAAVEDASPLPDAREIDGWSYSSLPLSAAVESGLIRIRRLRQTASPAGELHEEADEVLLQALDAGTLEREAIEAGLTPAGRRAVPPSDAHVGSTVLLLERGA